MRVIVIGSGFAGSILARCLHAAGLEVTLLERGRHPRFALGESSTPLAGLALARLGRRYGLDDLIGLATWGAWRRSLPDLECGLKRGFSFYRHRRGHPFAGGRQNPNRLLVAASPRDDLADTHWMRADVDAHLARQAALEGVDLREACEVRRLHPGDRWRVEVFESGRTRALSCDFVVDATGASAPVLAAAGEAHAHPRGFPHTWLLYGHFAGVRPLEACVEGEPLPDGPYEDSRAAVHHLVPEGWLYSLRFDGGTTSAGFVIERDADPALDRLLGRPDAAWEALLERYPTLGLQFGPADPIRGIRSVARLPRRASAAAGAGWAALPHAYGFLSPMFSTGIAWSLLAVERLVEVLIGAAGPRGAALNRYSGLLSAEFDHLQRLISRAYGLRQQFDAFAAWSMLYFAIASHAEVRQRMCDAPAAGWAWEGFAGAGDDRFVAAVRRAAERSADSLAREVGSLIAPWNVAGLADPARNRMYPVESAPVIESAALLGLTTAEAERRLPRLESPPGMRPSDTLPFGGFGTGSATATRQGLP